MCVCEVYECVSVCVGDVCVGSIWDIETMPKPTINTANTQDIFYSLSGSLPLSISLSPTPLSLFLSLSIQLSISLYQSFS